MRMYEEMGTQLALQYGGSQAVGTTNSNAAKDFLQSVKRFYRNTFSDFEKQQARRARSWIDLDRSAARPVHTRLDHTETGRLPLAPLLIRSWMSFSGSSYPLPVAHTSGTWRPTSTCTTDRLPTCTSRYTQLPRSEQRWSSERFISRGATRVSAPRTPVTTLLVVRLLPAILPAILPATLENVARAAVMAKSTQMGTRCSVTSMPRRRSAPSTRFSAVHICRCLASQRRARRRMRTRGAPPAFDTARRAWPVP